MKLTVLGGGGVRSLFLAKSIAQRAKSLGLRHLVFMDNDERKLSIYGRMAAHVAHMLDPGLDFSLTTDPVEAVRDADYLITTLRVGGDGMRVQDERIALNEGVLGQETTGAAGLSFAMRSVPALAEYCELVRTYSKPNALLFNFTNPAGVVSQTLRDMGYDFTYGICDAPSTLLHQIADLYSVDPARVRGECYGLNHLSFFSQVTIDGKDILPEFLAKDEAFEKTDQRYFEKKLVRHYGKLFNEYLYYFFYPEKSLHNILSTDQTRGELIARVNDAMTDELSHFDIDQQFDQCLKIFEKWYGKRENQYMVNETGIHRDKPWQFDIFEQDAGGYAGVALKFMEIRQSGKKDSMILCVPNKGAIPGLRDDDVVEITCDITSDACIPHSMEYASVGEKELELIRRVKAYERLASSAIRNKSKDDAIDCLMMHPLVNSFSLASSLAEKYFVLNKNYTKDWK